MRWDWVDIVDEPVSEDRRPTQQTPVTGTKTVTLPCDSQYTYSHQVRNLLLKELDLSSDRKHARPL